MQARDQEIKVHPITSVNNNIHCKFSNCVKWQSGGGLQKPLLKGSSNSNTNVCKLPCTYWFDLHTYRVTAFQQPEVTGP